MKIPASPLQRRSPCPQAPLFYSFCRISTVLEPQKARRADLAGMADGNTGAVGFGFQADIVSTGSLAHFLTGRILKALSDGKVDFYALAASIWLGKQIPVRSALETTVHTTIASRTGFQGILVQALTIGRGHSDVAIEMSRTKAGTNALLLIGALSAGSSYFAAAQVLSELLIISGCETDKVPTVDVLRPLIAYLAPFVRDLSFSKVLYHVTASAESIAMRRFNHSPAPLTAAGEAPILAAAIMQLILTSQRGETAYFKTYQRGAWLAVFANHILGMSVELVFNDTVLWAGAGTSGSVVFQVGQQTQGGAGTSLQSARAQAKITLVDPPHTADGRRPLILDCSLAEALGTSLDRHPLINQNIRRAIHYAIANLSRGLMEKLHMKSSPFFPSVHKINGQFDCRGALVETLSHLGLDEQAVQQSLRRVGTWRNGKAWTGSPTETNGLEHLDETGAQHLQQACPTHQAGLGGKLGRCICCHVGGIIHGFASSAVALVQCRYDTKEIRVTSSLLDGTATTSWVRGCIMEQGESSIALESRQLFSHLSRLLHNGDSDVPNEIEIQNLVGRLRILGISGGSTTVYYTLILSDDCYDTQGRLITISSGRASINGVMRQIIVEKNVEIPDIRYNQRCELPTAKTSQVAVGTYIQPHYRPGGWRIFMDAAVTEHEICISTAIGYDISKTIPVILSECIHNLFTTIILPPCGHSPDDPWKINHLDEPVQVSPFSRSMHSTGVFMVYALKGEKLEQLVQCRVEGCTLQLSTCLKCQWEFLRSLKCRGRRERGLIMA